MEPKVFQYEKPAEYLNSVFRSRKAKNPNYSLRSWSKQLGFSSSEQIARVLRGERDLTIRMATKISKQLKLADKEKKYFELLSLYSSSRSIDEKSLYHDLIKDIRLGTQYRSIELDQFHVMSDWFHVAILEMTQLSDFKNDPKWIAQKLGNKITSVMAQIAIERLIRLNLLKLDKNTKQLQRVDIGMIKYGDSTADEAIRNHHKQMIQLGVEAIENQEKNERELRCSTVSIRKKDYEVLKRMIQKFHDKIALLAANKNGEVLYQVNTQAFKLTENPGENK